MYFLSLDLPHGEGTTKKKPRLGTCRRKNGWWWWGKPHLLMISGWCHQVVEVHPKKEMSKG